MFKVDEQIFNTLTERQKKYFRIMRAQSGVLFITANCLSSSIND